jgi:hypothetical protein
VAMMTSPYDIRQALFDLRHQVNAIRHESEVNWDLVGDVAVAVVHDGVAKDFGSLLLRAHEDKDIQLLFDILFMHATSVLDYKELGKREHWGSSIDATGRPDEVRFEELLFEDAPWGGRLRRHVFQYVLSVSSLPSVYAKHGRQHGWAKNLRPGKPTWHEYVVHAHWPAHWGDFSLLPRRYTLAIDATTQRRQRGEVEITKQPTSASFDIRLEEDAGEISTFAIGMDFYAMWIAIEDHTTFVENIAKEHKKLRW